MEILGKQDPEVQSSPKEMKKEPDNAYTANKTIQRKHQNQYPQTPYYPLNVFRNPVPSAEEGTQTTPPKPYPTVSNMKRNLTINLNTTTGQRVITTINEAVEDAATVEILNSTSQ